MPSPASSSLVSATDLPIRRIRRWQHWHAVGQILRDYPPGADALVDNMRTAPGVVRFALRHLVGPLYFGREQGWLVRGSRGEIAAMMYLRRQNRLGIRVLHIDDINVSVGYLRRGLAQRLLTLAEELAREEQRPFLKLAVTVANTPAVTLYRRLGYQEQHHRFYTLASPLIAPKGALSRDLALRRLSRTQAAEAFERFYRLEMAATAPAVADLMVAYYSQGGSDITGTRTWQRGYAVERSGQMIGYGDLFRQKTQVHLRLSLRPELWGTDVELQAIQLLSELVRNDANSAVTFNVPSAGHFDVLAAGPHSLADALGLTEQSAARMIMVKPLASAS